MKLTLTIIFKVDQENVVSSQVIDGWKSESDLKKHNEIDPSVFVLVNLRGMKVIVVDNLLGLHLPLLQVIHAFFKYDYNDDDQMLCFCRFFWSL
jgi:hypothetical protein